MEIGEPEFSREDGVFECRFNVRFNDEQRNLWYRLDKKYGSFVSKRSDAALVALLIPAMQSGEDIYINGTVSERLYYTCSRAYQHVLRAMMPEQLCLVKVRAAAVQPAPDQASGVATGFSAGIDSFCVLADHYYASGVPDGFSISHLLYNNVGSHGSGGEHLFRKRCARIRPLTDRIGLPFVAVNSNVSAFYDHNTLGFQRTHTPRNVSVSLLLQKKFGKFLYGSTYRYDETYVGNTYDIAYSDPVCLPLTSTGALDAISVGGEYTRVEKTLKVVDLEDSYYFLDVCVDPEDVGNCSTCWKCVRTILTLDIAGVLDRYEQVFDLEAYRENRNLYIARKLLSDDPLDREVVSFAREENFTIPIGAYGYKVLLRLNRIRQRL